MRILIIGIDGGTWKVLDRLEEEGVMPYLSSLNKSGAKSILKSTELPITAPAWTTFMTGVSPARHGIFEFNNYNGKYGTYFVTNSHIKYKTIWELLSELGKRIISINVPMTYPPFPVRGQLVTGMLTPGTKVTFTYPPELTDEIREEFPEYRIMTTGAVYSRYGIKRFVSELKKTIQNRVNLAKYLLHSPDWDVAMVHFQSSDIVQHFLYHCIEPEHPLFKPKCRQLALEVYKELDRAIEQLHQWVEKTGKVFLIIMSDHGFKPVTKLVDTNGLLLKHGFLVMKRSSKRVLHEALRIAKKFDFLKINKILIKKEKRRALREAIFREIGIDFSSTRAFSLNGWVYGNIYINLKGREPQGIVELRDYDDIIDEIKTIFENEVDPETEEKPFKAVKKSEAFGKTDHVEAPDLIIMTDRYYEFSFFPFSNPKKYFKHNKPKTSHTGNHDENGILLMSGEGIKQGIFDDANIIDLLPTILWYMELPIPNYVEGKVLKHFFRQDFSQRKSEKRKDISPQRIIDIKFHEDEDELKKTLKGLGYL